MSDSWESLRAKAAAGKSGRTYWRSLEELADTAEFREAVEREFPPQASELLDSSRRGFLKVMGASVALAGLASCRRWPEQQVLPYSRRTPGRSEGVPVHYTTAYEVNGIAQGLLAVSFDGRPIKIEGNPQHPLNQGATDQFAQATVLQLYDPDRSRGVIDRTGSSPVARSWDEFIPAARTALSAAGGYVLSEATSSPSFAAMRAQLQQAYPNLKWVEYDAVSSDARREGTRIAFGAPYRAVYELGKAKSILVIDSDIFCNGNPITIKYARDFANGRRVENEKAASMNRLWVVESTFTNTGAQADHRRGATPFQIRAFISELAVALGVAGATPTKSGIDVAFIEKLAADLRAAGGQAAIIAGHQLQPELQALVLAMNAQLGAIGQTLTLYPDPDAQRPSHLDAIKNLAADMDAGRVETLLILGGNPAYDAPADLDFAGKLAKVKNKIRFGLYEDETSLLCNWHASQAHFLEAWGDARTFDGTVSIVQPLIEPLFDGKSGIELLSLLAGKNQKGYDIVRSTMGVTAITEWRWKKALYDGFIDGSAIKPVTPRLDVAGIARAVAADAAGPKVAGAYEIVLRVDSKVIDGRFANIGWLQELPDPITRVTWDNVAAMSLVTAEKLKVGNGDLIKIDAGGKSLEIAAWIVPGIPENVINLSLGYGRTAAGILGNGVGFNTYVLRTTTSPWVMSGSVSAVGKKYAIAAVQHHHLTDAVGRKAVQHRVPELVREATFNEFKHDPSLGYKKIVSLSIFNEHDTQQAHKWGMAIDLTTCVGCSACVVACQSENNIPIVGKEQVLHGREMHWIRIDRYFRETPEEPVSVNQPVLCMHCETAPCEEVCPVAATTHSKEGINMMTYNRCIGTRYCSNNCPYKVRRFNFFDYNSGTIHNLYTPNLLRSDLDELRKMQKNPQVTVRSRGVMEKCTYCVQRIENKRIEAWNEGRRPIKDGELQTACQQVCPTQAIVFGDLNDPNSRVRKLHDQTSTYGMLDAELNTKPRTQYRTKLRNPVEGLDAKLYEDHKRVDEPHGAPGHTERGH